MKQDLRILLAQLAAMLSVTACSCSASEASGGGDDGSGDDVGGGQVGPCASQPAPLQVSVTSDTACQLYSATGSAFSRSYSSVACHATCAAPYDECLLPDSFVQAMEGDGGDAGEDGGASCAAVAADVQVTCSVDCTGRSTAGMASVVMGDQLDLGDYLAACAHLEAVSVHAFERLARELACFGAPDALVEAARSAAREEVEHADDTARLAELHGGRPVTPEPLSDHATRSLFAVAYENAVEGCVRETYGAALALVRAARATDHALRRSLAKIAREECGHAELSWQIRGWLDERLTPRERSLVRGAARSAARGLAFTDERLTRRAREQAGMPTAEECAVLASAMRATIFDRAS